MAYRRVFAVCTGVATADKVKPARVQQPQQNLMG
jgi:hypothetical protein